MKKLQLRNAAAVLLCLTALLWMSASYPAYAGGNYVEGEALVVLKNRLGTLNAASLSGAAGKSYIQGVAASAGAEAVTTYSALSLADGEIFIHVRSATKSTEELITELKKNPDVISASPNYVGRVLAAPNDPRLGELWGMRAIGARRSSTPSWPCAGVLPQAAQAA